MTVDLEIAVATGLFIVIVGFALAVSFVLLFLYPWLQARAERKKYPHITRQGLRVARIPVPNIGVNDVERALDMFMARAADKGYDDGLLLAEFGSSYLRLVRAVNDDERRYVFTDDGRKVAGHYDFPSRVMTLAVLDDDRWEDTAGFHEMGHVAHETKGKADYKHRDDVMWHDIVGWCRKEFANA